MVACAHAANFTWHLGHRGGLLWMSIRGQIIKKQNVIQESLTSKVQKLKVWISVGYFWTLPVRISETPGKNKAKELQGQHIPTRSRHLFGVLSDFCESWWGIVLYCSHATQMKFFYPFCGKVMWGSVFTHPRAGLCRLQGIKILIDFAHLNNGLGQSMGNLHSGTIDHCQGHHVLVRTVVLLAMSHHIRNRFKPVDLYIHVDVPRFIELFESNK